MFRIFFTLTLLFSIQTNNYAQHNVSVELNAIPDANCISIDALSSYIKQNFNTDSARIRAIYLWVTGHISYDVPRFLGRDKSPKSVSPTLAEVFSKRTGVCQDYSDLFVVLCKGSSIDAFRIAGYTKQQGKVGEVSHAWVAAKLDGAWHLFDPTWGAGYVMNEVFVKRFNNELYKVPPTKFIADHMPFDPLFQFLPYPISNHEFTQGKPAAGKTLFNYSDSINQHRRLSTISQASAELRRLEAGGFNNNMLQERRTYLKNIIQSADSKNSFEESSKAYNDAVYLFREFVGHKKNKFSDIADVDLQHIVDSIEIYIKRSREMVLETAPKSDAQWESKTRQIASINKLWIELIKQKDFTLKYIATEKEKRKLLFMR